MDKYPKHHLEKKKGKTRLVFFSNVNRSLMEEQCTLKRMRRLSGIAAVIDTELIIPPCPNLLFISSLPALHVLGDIKESERERETRWYWYTLAHLVFLSANPAPILEAWHIDTDTEVQAQSHLAHVLRFHNAKNRYATPYSSSSSSTKGREALRSQLVSISP